MHGSCQFTRLSARFVMCGMWFLFHIAGRHTLLAVQQTNSFSQQRVARMSGICSASCAAFSITRLQCHSQSGPGYDYAVCAVVPRSLEANSQGAAAKPGRAHKAVVSDHSSRHEEWGLGGLGFAIWASPPRACEYPQWFECTSRAPCIDLHMA